MYRFASAVVALSLLSGCTGGEGSSSATNGVQSSAGNGAQSSAVATTSSSVASNGQLSAAFNFNADAFSGFSDTTSGNQFPTPCGNGSSDVDLSAGPSGGCMVGYTEVGEWLDYRLTNLKGGKYTLNFDVGSDLSSRTVNIQIDGTSVGTISVPMIGWDSYATQSLNNVSISAGNHTLRVVFTTGGVNLDKMSLVHTAFAGTTTPPASSAITASSSSANNGGIVGSAAAGQALWNSKTCFACHGVDGKVNADGSSVLTTLDANRAGYRHSMDATEIPLDQYIAKWMPPSNTASCDAQCGADIAAYIVETFRDTGDGIPENPVSTFSCPTSNSYGYRTIRLLTQDQYQRSVGVLLGYQEDIRELLPTDFVSGVFVNNNVSTVDKSLYGSYVAVAEKIAKATSGKWNSVLGCDPAQQNSNCANKLVDDLAPKIFRRPLTTDEKTVFRAIADGSKNGVSQKEGMEIALAAMLSAPQFIYRSEVGESQGNGTFKLTGYEIATYLAFTLTGKTPSDTLLAAAGRGDLNTVDGIRQQANTLLNSAESKEIMEDLVHRWLGTGGLASFSKEGVNNFKALAADMIKELSKNFSSVVLDGSKTFADLYTPGFTYVNQALATHYGLPFGGGADADGFAKVSTGERGGVLLNGAFMSRYAHADDANLITRAVAMRRRMLCQDIPEPPSGVSQDRDLLAQQFADFFNDPKTTQRMQFEKITSSGVCTQCHTEIINPLGAGLEHFDTLGRLREVGYKGNPIDATGTFFSPFPQLQFYNDPDRVIYSPAITFNNGQELAEVFAENDMVSELAQTCLATQMISYSSGIHSIFLIDSDRDVGSKRISKQEEESYRCDITDLTNTLSSQGPRAMLQQLSTLESVLYRKEWAR